MPFLFNCQIFDIFYFCINFNKIKKKYIFFIIYYYVLTNLSIMLKFIYKIVYKLKCNLIFIFIINFLIQINK